MKQVPKTLITFSIGFTAGVAPFLFMQILPALMDTGSQFEMPNLTPVIMTGVLIGAIISILYTKGFESREPKDIFFHALGIPAILIATVSNMNSKYQTITAQRDASSMVIASTEAPTTVKKGVKVLQRPKKPMVNPVEKPVNSSSLWTSEAWAADITDINKDKPLLIAMDAPQGFTVVIGTYGSEERAWEAVDSIEETKLGTEKYIGKALQVLAGEDNIFYVTYGESTTEEEANKIFRLLKINDKKISPKILRLD